MAPRRANLSAAALLLLSTVAMFVYLFAAPSNFVAPVSNYGRQELARTMRRAEPVDIEAPPSDTELLEKVPKDPLPFRRRRAKRDIPGTLCYVHKQQREEAYRFKSILEPLLDKQLGINEITFVLNREGRKYRHLLWRPRLGLPVFTRHKVRRLLRRAYDETGFKLNKRCRPEKYPPFAPGCNYPPSIKESYAEVPPLKPWTPAGSRELPEASEAEVL